MFRTLILASIVPFVVACQSTQPAMNEETMNAPVEEEILEPTDGIDNETGVN